MRPSSSGIGSVGVPSKSPEDETLWERETWKVNHRTDGDNLGEGGWGVVIPVIHLPSGERRALKRPIRDTPEVNARFKREIEVQTKLVHPNVMQILEHCRDLGWFTMPLASRTLRQTACELSADEIVGLILQIARGLAAAHDNKFIHRDVKPGNIFEYEIDSDLRQRRWVVGDFGIVHRPSSQGTDLETSRVLGTSGFIAPEVALGSSADISAATDVYSLGRTLAWVLTGKVAENFAPIAVPSPWSTLVAKMTEFQPANRLQTMAEVIAGVLIISDEVRNARRQSWGTAPRSELSSDDEAVLLAIIDNPMDPEDADSDLAVSYRRLTSLFASTALLHLSLRRLVERNYVRQGVYSPRGYDDGPDVRTYMPTDHAWRWLEDNVERLRPKLLPEVETPAEPVAQPVDDEIPF